MSFLRPNINRRGRLIRAAWGLACLGGAWWASGSSWWLAGLLAVLGVFALFEAARGWCVIRACGIKTKW